VRLDVEAPPAPAKLDVIFVATDLEIVKAMLTLADVQRIREAQANAVRAGVTDRVTFRVQDIFDTDIRPATVVTLFLSPELNARMRPKVTSQLRPGIGDWVPEKSRTVMVSETRNHIFLWRVP
jgi:23S rRNA G2445 N2-methylase RlmL